VLLGCVAGFERTAQPETAALQCPKLSHNSFELEIIQMSSKPNFKTLVSSQACNPSTWEVEAGGSRPA
jgi:hypothetical protein